jgi:GxxExxY protein
MRSLSSCRHADVRLSSSGNTQCIIAAISSGKLVPDLIVDGKVIADPKVVTDFNENHIAQMLGYLNITGLEVALLLNFKNAKLEWKRVVREKGGKNAGGVNLK